MSKTEKRITVASLVRAGIKKGSTLAAIKKTVNTKTGKDVTDTTIKFYVKEAILGGVLSEEIAKKKYKFGENKRGPKPKGVTFTAKGKAPKKKTAKKKVAAKKKTAAKKK